MGSPPPHPLNKRWFVHTGGNTLGPHTGHVIRQLVEQRKIFGNELVYPEGGSEWTQLKNDPILRSTLENLKWTRLENDSTLSGSPTPRLKRKLAPRLILLAGLAFLAVLGWTAWPYYTAYKLVIAARNGDVPTLENLVAWESVREGVRTDANAFFLRG